MFLFYLTQWKDGDWIIDAVALGFTQWDDEVEDLDAGNSDEVPVIRHVQPPPVEGRRPDPQCVLCSLARASP